MTPEFSKLLTDSNISNKLMIGWVVDNNDPLKLQRIRIRSPIIHRFIDDDCLPWAIRIGDNNSIVTGDIKVPVQGTKVIFYYQDNNIEFPVYVGSPCTQDCAILELIETDYPYVYGRIDGSGNLLLINTLRDTVKFVHISGTNLSIDGSGHINIDVANFSDNENATTIHDAGITINILGSAKINASESISLNSTDIEMNCSNLNINADNLNLKTIQSTINSNQPLTLCSTSFNFKTTIVGYDPYQSLPIEVDPRTRPIIDEQTYKNKVEL